LYSAVQSDETSKFLPFLCLRAAICIIALPYLHNYGQKSIRSPELVFTARGIEQNSERKLV
jgi:hypothetical protein